MDDKASKPYHTIISYSMVPVIKKWTGKNRAVVLLLLHGFIWFSNVLASGHNKL